MKRLIIIAFVCALGWLGFISGKNDGCGNTYYNSSKDQKCYHCTCHQPGITTGGCATGSGQCNCKPGHTNRRCNGCLDGWYVDKKRSPCKTCGCNKNGAYNTTCDRTGQCYCKPTHHGKQCNQCPSGQFLLKNGTCGACGCNKNGAYNTTCDGTGQCYCKPTHHGKQCKCPLGKFLNKDGTCEDCACDETGSKDMNCDPKSGKCPCKRAYITRTCSEVQTYYITLGSSNYGALAQFKFVCDGFCDTRSLFSVANTGNVNMYGSTKAMKILVDNAGYGYLDTKGTFFCRGTSTSTKYEKCNTVKQLNMTEFYIALLSLGNIRRTLFFYKVGNAKDLYLIRT